MPITNEEKRYRLTHKRCIFCQFASKHCGSWNSTVTCKVKGSFILEPVLPRLFCFHYKADLERDITK